LSGRLVRTLLAGETLPAGTHHAVWDGRDTIGRPVGAGVYFYSVRTATFADTKRMALIK
jgi:flagellar hook assembly protein FlgD